MVRANRGGEDDTTRVQAAADASKRDADPATAGTFPEGLLDDKGYKLGMMWIAYIALFLRVRYSLLQRFNFSLCIVSLLLLQLW